MIDWSEYEPLILELHRKGMSSTQIAEILSKTNSRIDSSKSRHIRKIIQKNRHESKNKPAKILLFDIETAPMVAYIWNPKTRFVQSSHIAEDWFVLCWSAKWLFNDEIMSSSVTPKESKNRDDKRVVEELWKLLDEADIVIAHNGDNFDVRKMNARFALYGLNLPSPYQTIDTYKAARKRLNLSYYSLFYVAQYFNLKNQKQDTTFELWKGCLEGDVKSLEKMQKYCDQDIRTLEDVYLHLRPFIQPHPNLGLFIESDTRTCPSCGSNHLKPEGYYATTVNLYEAFRCDDCGSLTRSRNTAISKEEKQTITSSLPR